MLRLWWSVLCFVHYPPYRIATSISPPEIAYSRRRADGVCLLVFRFGHQRLILSDPV